MNLNIVDGILKEFKIWWGNALNLTYISERIIKRKIVEKNKTCYDFQFVCFESFPGENHMKYYSCRGTKLRLSECWGTFETTSLASHSSRTSLTKYLSATDPFILHIFWMELVNRLHKALIWFSIWNKVVIYHTSNNNICHCWSSFIRITQLWQCNRTTWPMLAMLSSGIILFYTTAHSLSALFF